MRYSALNRRQLSPAPSDCLDGGNQIAGCKQKNMGGTSALFYALFNTATTFTINTADDTITFVSGATLTSPIFYKYDTIRTPSGVKSTTKSNEDTGIVYDEQTSSMTIFKTTPTSRLRLKQFERSRVHTIELDNNGYYWLLGKNFGMDIADGSGMESGDKRDASNSVKINMIGYEQEPKYNITGLSAFTWSY